MITLIEIVSILVIIAVAIYYVFQGIVETVNKHPAFSGERVPNKRPRYRVFISLQKDNSFRYYFEDTEPPYKNMGRVMLYDGGKKDFVYMMNPHDAIVYCNELNEKEETK